MIQQGLCRTACQHHHLPAQFSPRIFQACHLAVLSFGISSLLLRFPEVVTLEEDTDDKAGDAGCHCKESALFGCSKEESFASIVIKVLCVSLFATLSLINSILSKSLHVGGLDPADPDLDVISLF